MAVCGEYVEGARDRCYHCGHHREEHDLKERHVPLEQRIEDMLPRCCPCRVFVGEEVLIIHPPDGRHPRHLAAELVKLMDRPRILR